MSTTNYDFILLEDNKEQLIVRYNSTPDTFNYTKSTVKFLACEIIIDNIKYEINNDNYNVSGNVLFDQSFVEMYVYHEL